MAVRPVIKNSFERLDLAGKRQMIQIINASIKAGFMSARYEVLECRGGSIDERLPYGKEWVETCKKQAEAIPLEIEHNNMTYEAFDYSMEIEGTILSDIVFYAAKERNT